jgi:hypothetical protein
MEIAVWCAGSGIWFVLPSNSPGNCTVTQWGIGTDVPISAITETFRSTP